MVIIVDEADLKAILTLAHEMYADLEWSTASAAAIMRRMLAGERIQGEELAKIADDFDRAHRCCVRDRATLDRFTGPPESTH